MKPLKSWILTAAFGMALMGSVFGQTGASPFLLHYKAGPSSLPVAIYQGIGVDKFRKLVTGAFEASQFSLVDIEKTKDGVSQYSFSYPAPSGGKAESVTLVLKVDENLDRNKRCANCFLRLAALPEALAIQKLPWMAQYDLSSQILPAIDRAFDKIRIDGQKYMDPRFGFNYKSQWQGERNLFGNSFSGVGLPELKAATVDAYRAAGFVFTRAEQNNPNGGPSELSFVFPLDPDQPAGAVYKVFVYKQLDASGNCHPCEMSESFDPHQTLPAAGLSGMASRLTLESRFTAARTLAYEKLRNATERYLRPRSVFAVPPKPAPLGSPRPPIMPAVVT